MEDKAWLGGRAAYFDEAYPNVERIDFTIDDNLYGWLDIRGSRPLNFTAASSSRFVPCPNDRCRRGGFDFGAFLRNHSYESQITTIDKTYPCGGDEGTPAGRRKGDPCMKGFKVKRTIVYKPATEYGGVFMSVRGLLF
ncbi:hypothetical protein CLG96_05865 [Sphingomonas oleivorans]|uniref:Uncharacterized protein n=1 Tax=Sphingomonas oleivorans TaxID=1735121 RepID=A0A2T5FZG5_9SPHN|nr:hypothetical protein CLG96_05865 [Sphingomonas oleivorans]